MLYNFKTPFNILLNALNKNGMQPLTVSSQPSRRKRKRNEHYKQHRTMDSNKTCMATLGTITLEHLSV